MAVVGGGVVGRAAARALAVAGHDVVLADAGGPAASSVPVALLNPHRGRTGRAHPDDVAALATLWRWTAELAAEGRDPGAHRTGVARVADSAAQARAFAEAGLRPVAPTAVAVRAPHGAFLVPDGGWVDPAAHLAALTASAVARGARVLEGTALASAVRGRDGAWRLGWAPADDGPTEVDVVVLATGAHAWTAPLRAAFGPEPVLERHAGDVLVTDDAAPAMPLAGATYVGPVATPHGPRAAIGGHHRPPGPPAADAGPRLRAAVAWALPHLAASGRADKVWWGVRARLPGGRPVVAWRAPGVLWLGGFAGRGFLAAAAAADAAVAALAAA